MPEGGQKIFVTMSARLSLFQKKSYLTRGQVLVIKRESMFFLEIFVNRRVISLHDFSPHLKLWPFEGIEIFCYSL